MRSLNNAGTELAGDKADVRCRWTASVHHASWTSIYASLD
jgi:hypothetical protein